MIESIVAAILVAAPFVGLLWAPALRWCAIAALTVGSICIVLLHLLVYMCHALVYPITRSMPEFRPRQLMPQEDDR